MQKQHNLVELLQHRADTTPQKIAYRFLQDGTTETAQITYAQLNLQARAIAAKLQTLTQPRSRVVLVYTYDAAIEFVAAFMGCLYADAIAVTTTPPRNGKDLGKLAQRVADSGAEVILTTSDIIEGFKSKIITNLGVVNKFKHLKWFTTDDIDRELAVSWQQPTIEPDTIAFLQYTSGSTGIPKGVMVTHGNILHNEEMIRQGFAHDENTIVVGWLPLFHDMGLIGNVLQPLYLGTESLLMSPVALAQKPFEWLKAITNYRATTSGGPNFAYDLLCLRATEEYLAQLDLSNWRVAFSGAETVRAETLERFSQIFAPCGFDPKAFYPCYGMAETTLFVTGGQANQQPKVLRVNSSQLEQNKVVVSNAPDGKAIVSCGQTWLDTEVIIVNPETLTECQTDEVGEIWVRGSGVGKGYWQQAQATQDTFAGKLAEADSGDWLRTGDLGFMAAGELYITGRLKEVMIFRGRYCYPQHVEQTVQAAHPALRANAGAAFSLDLAGAERLIVVQEVTRQAMRSLSEAEKISKIVTAICQQVGEEHEVEVHGICLLKTGSIPKTSSGKIQRRRCAQLYQTGELNVVAQWPRE